MIDPDTPAGAEVVCIDAAPGPYGSGGLTLGEVYTVGRIFESIEGGHVVVVEEIPSWTTYAPPWGLVEIGFGLQRFRYLDMPREFTDLLAIEELTVA